MCQTTVCDRSFSPSDRCKYDLNIKQINIILECKRVALYETWHYFPMVSVNLVSKDSEQNNLDTTNPFVLK